GYRQTSIAGLVRGHAEHDLRSVAGRLDELPGDARQPFAAGREAPGQALRIAAAGDELQARDGQKRGAAAPAQAGLGHGDGRARTGPAHDHLRRETAAAALRGQVAAYAVEYRAEERVAR